MGGLSPAEWVDALVAAFPEVATTALSLPDFAVTARHDQPPAEMCGAYLGLVGPGAHVQVGVAASLDACRALARSLLLMAPDEAISDSDTADAVCEIVNMLAGCVQRRVRPRAEVQLGLPTFFRGPVQPTERLGAAVAEFRAGAQRGALLLVHPRTAA